MQIDLDSVEAFVVLEAVQDHAMDWLIASAKKGPQGEYAEVRSKVLQRVATRIADVFIPEPVGHDDSDPRRRILEDEIEFGIA